MQVMRKENPFFLFSWRRFALQRCVGFCCTTMEKWKLVRCIENKMKEVNPPLSAITLNINEWNFPVKRQRWQNELNIMVRAPPGSSGQESACWCRGHGFDPWYRKTPHSMEQLSLCAPPTEAHTPRAFAPQEQPPQWEARTPQAERTLACCTWRKPVHAAKTQQSRKLKKGHDPTLGCLQETHFRCEDAKRLKVNKSERQEKDSPCQY